VKPIIRLIIKKVIQNKKKIIKNCSFSKTSSAKVPVFVYQNEHKRNSNTGRISPLAS